MWFMGPTIYKRSFSNAIAISTLEVFQQNCRVSVCYQVVICKGEKTFWMPFIACLIIILKIPWQMNATICSFHQIKEQSSCVKHNLISKRGHGKLLLFDLVLRAYFIRFKKRIGPYFLALQLTKLINSTPNRGITNPQISSPQQHLQ